MCSGDGGGAGDGTSASVIDAIGIDTGASQGNAPGVVGGPDAAAAAGVAGVGSPSSISISPGAVARTVFGLMMAPNPVSPSIAHAVAQKGGDVVAAMMGHDNAVAGAQAGVTAMGSGGGVPAGVVSTDAVTGITNDTNAGGSQTGGIGDGGHSLFDPAHMAPLGGQPPASIYNPGGLRTWSYTPPQMQQSFLNAPANASPSYAADYGLLEDAFRRSYQSPILNAQVYRPGGLL